jgi:hypothetical protein
MITLPALRRAPSVNRVAVNRSRQELRAFELLHVLPANRHKKRVDERTRTAFLLITSDASGVGGGLRRVANAAYLEGFLFSGLLHVAPYCAPGGVRVVSSVVSTPWISRGRFHCARYVRRDGDGLPSTGRVHARLLTLPALQWKCVASSTWSRGESNP